MENGLGLQDNLEIMVFTLMAGFTVGNTCLI